MGLGVKRDGGKKLVFRRVPRFYSYANSSRGLLVALLLLAGATAVVAQQFAWQDDVRTYVTHHDLDTALNTIDARLAEAPGDLEAHGWRGRVLAWRGSWAQAEVEYRTVLQRAPDDVDMLTGLADVLLWQCRPEEALALLDRASKLTPSNPEVLVRRGRTLAVLGRKTDARADFRKALAFDGENQPAKSGLRSLRGEARQELRTGLDIDSFNYTDSAYAQVISLSSRWSQRWSTVFASNFYQRFGEDATKFSASTAFRPTSHDWLGVEGAVSNDRGIIAKHELAYEYGHAFRLHHGLIRGLELSHQQRWLWFQDAQVLTLTTSQVLYLPKDWTWSLAITAARSRFAGLGSEWQPSGASRLGFPLIRRLTGSVAFGVGSENFALVDQTGRFAARTFSGGLGFRMSANQDFSGYVAAQDRSQGRSQRSVGISYAVRF
jgi:Tfp pilus assembly protein PilF